MNRPVIYQAASICLSYPDQHVLGRAGLVRAALTEAAPAALCRFQPLLDWWRATPDGVLQSRYVELFDLSRRHALYLSYWTDGDTRRRGQVLADFKQRFRGEGLVLAGSDELPDYLPLVLEFARHRPEAGRTLLQEYRASLELLRLALLERDPRYAAVVAAVCATLPGVSPADRHQASQLAAAGPPAESVGLDASDPRLLPLGPTVRSRS